MVMTLNLSPKSLRRGCLYTEPGFEPEVEPGLRVGFQPGLEPGLDNISLSRHFQQKLLSMVDNEGKFSLSPSSSPKGRPTISFQSQIAGFLFKLVRYPHFEHSAKLLDKYRKGSSKHTFHLITR